MPSYDYKCSACGNTKEVFYKKISDAPAQMVCPVCGKETFMKQISAAGFQLKGSGWYVTDFRGGSGEGSGGSSSGGGSSSSGGGESPSGSSSGGASSGGSSSGGSTAAAHGCGPGCACGV